MVLQEDEMDDEFEEFKKAGAGTSFVDSQLDNQEQGDQS